MNVCTYIFFISQPIEEELPAGERSNNEQFVEITGPGEFMTRAEPPKFVENPKTPEFWKPADRPTAVEPARIAKPPRIASFIEVPKETYTEELSKTPEDARFAESLPQVPQVLPQVPQENSIAAVPQTSAETTKQSQIASKKIQTEQLPKTPEDAKTAEALPQVPQQTSPAALQQSSAETTEQPQVASRKTQTEELPKTPEDTKTAEILPQAPQEALPAILPQASAEALPKAEVSSKTSEATTEGNYPRLQSQFLQ